MTKKEKRELGELQQAVLIGHRRLATQFVNVSTYKSAIVVWMPGMESALWMGADNAEDLAKALLAAAKRRRVLDAIERKRNPRSLSTASQYPSRRRKKATKK